MQGSHVRTEREENMSRAKKNNEQTKVVETEQTKVVETPETISGEVVNNADIKRFEQLDKRIGAEVRSVESSMLSIMGALAVISEKNLHRTAGYKTARDYIADRHGMNISKAQLSDAVNTFKKFGDMETGYLKDEWTPFTFSQLKLMRRLTDEEIEKVTPDTSVRKIQEMINSSKAIEESSTDESSTEESSIEESSTEESSTNITKVENSGNVEPYIEMTYSMAEFAELNADVLKGVIMEAFKAGNNVRLNYTID